MHGEAKAFLKVWSIIFTSLAYCFFIVSTFPKGKFRLISLVPIFYLYTILPLHLSSVLPCGVTAFFITWLANFKLFLFAFDRGPLTTSSFIGTTRGGLNIRNLKHNAKCFVRFVILAAFPIKISQSQRPKKVIPLNLWSETLISSILIVVCDRYKGQLHSGLVCVIYCCLLYVIVDVIIGISNLFVKPIMGVELVPPSDEPYLSTSLQDFWARRWNLMVTDLLRHTIYNPTRAFLSNHMGTRLAAGLAVLSAFGVSGVMHELIFYYMTRVSPSWEVTWYFVLNGLCVVVETALKRNLGRKFKLHWALSGPLTVGFAAGTGYLWFFPPLLRSHVDLKTIEEFKTAYEFTKGMLKSAL